MARSGWPWSRYHLPLAADDILIFCRCLFLWEFFSRAFLLLGNFAPIPPEEQKKTVLHMFPVGLISAYFPHRLSRQICTVKELFFRDLLCKICFPQIPVPGKTRATGRDSCPHQLCECDREFAMCLKNFACPKSKAACRDSGPRFIQNLIMAFGAPKGMHMPHHHSHPPPPPPSKTVVHHHSPPPPHHHHHSSGPRPASQTPHKFHHGYPPPLKNHHGNEVKIPIKITLSSPL